MAMMRKILSLACVLILTFSMSTVAFADEVQSEFATTSINEYDYVATLDNSSSIELHEMGITEAEAQRVIEAYNDGLEERAMMSDEELYGLGYSPSDINLLRKYKATGSLTEAEQYALAASCDGYITASNMTDSQVIFKYNWEWDQSPIVVGTDAAAVQWIAYADNLESIGVRRSDSECKVTYYYGNSSKGSAYGEKGDKIGDKVADYTFDIGKTTTSSTGDVVYAYAKKGYIEVSLYVPGATRDLSYVAVGGLYGHTNVNLGPTPSVNYSAGSTDLSLSFTPSWSVDETAPARVHIEQGSSATRPVVIDQY